MLTREQRERIIDQDTRPLLERVESITLELELLGNEAVQGYFHDDCTRAERSAAAKALGVLVAQAGQAMEELK